MCIGRQYPYVEEETEIKDGKVTERDVKCEYCENPITINIIKKKGGVYVVKYKCNQCGTEKECRFSKVSYAYDEMLKMYWNSKKR